MAHIAAIGEVMVELAPFPTADSNGREIMAQALSAGTGVMGQQMAAVYQQQQMNRQCFLGLTHHECHFARYQRGDFYQTHLDAFRGAAALLDGLEARLAPPRRAALLQRLGIIALLRDGDLMAAGQHFAQAIERLHRAALGRFKPDLTFILDLPVADGLARAAARRGSETRYERMALEFHTRVRKGFRAIARDEPRRCALVNAGADIATIEARLRAIVETRLGRALAR